MRERKRKDREALNSWGRSFFTFQLLLLSENRFSKNYQKQTERNAESEIHVYSEERSPGMLYEG